MNDLQTLVSEYNEVETTQAARLKAIYELAAALEGGGHGIKFSNGLQIDHNLLHHVPDRSIVNLQLDKLIALITSWQ